MIDGSYMALPGQTHGRAQATRLIDGSYMALTGQTAAYRATRLMVVTWPLQGNSDWFALKASRSLYQT